MLLQNIQFSLIIAHYGKLTVLETENSMKMATSPPPQKTKYYFGIIFIIYFNFSVTPSTLF